MAEITEKQKIFCDEYLVDFNATRAYKAAYPGIKNDNAAAATASKLLRTPKVAAYIKERIDDRQKRTEITQDKVLRELAAIGFSDIADYVKVVEKEAPGADEGEAVKYNTVEVLLTDDIPDDKRAAIAGIKKGANGIEIKLADKLKALELLGKHLGLFVEKQEIEQSGEINVNIKVV